MERVNEAVFAAVRSVAQEKSLPLESINAHCKLVDDLGFVSLDLARIVAMIELALDADPFARLVPVTSIRTIGDLCAAYARCFAPDAAAQGPAPAENAQSRDTRARRTDERAQQRDLRKRARGGTE